MGKKSISKYVLASVFDKKGIASFCNSLKKFGYKIIATEGTSINLRKHNVPNISAERVSGNPNKLRECIKTISYNIEAGILFDRQDTHQVKEANQLKVRQMDIVICNFVPLDKVRKDPDKYFDISNVDVGGPLMVRSAATNYKNVLTVVDPGDYKKVIHILENDKNTVKFREKMAKKAFEYTCNYDKEIVDILK